MSTAHGKVWLITGTSSGLGKHLVEKAVARGDRVIATARQTSNIEDLAIKYPANIKVFQLDVTDPYEELCLKAKEAFSIWNDIDIVVNNAGFGCFGVLEEGGVEALMKIYKTNVFGAVNVTNAFLPYLRAKRDGTIIFIGSRSGWRSKFMGNGFYGSSKAAIHSIADALAEEVRPFGIAVYNIMPGGIRTQGINNIRWTRGDSLSENSPKAIADYNEMNNDISTYFRETNGNEIGDPRKVANIIVDLVHREGFAAEKQPNVSLFLGSDVGMM